MTVCVWRFLAQQGHLSDICASPEEETALREVMQRKRPWEENARIDVAEYRRGSNRVNATASSAKTRVKVA
jgi:hypothetical protein